MIATLTLAKLAKDAGPWIAKILPWIMGALLIVAIVWWLRADAYSDGVKSEQAKVERANAAALRIKSAADTIAAAQRLKDAQRLSQASKDRTDAIDKAPDSKTGAATLALGCARWVQQNPGRTDRPAACR